MSVEGIRKVIRRHTGDNAGNQKISHGEVEEMLRSAGDGGHVAVGERLELLSALTMFGGNADNPSLFAPADKKALADAAVAGIETPAAFMKLSRRDQGRFVYWGLYLGGGQQLGFSFEAGLPDRLPANVREWVDACVAADRKKAGANAGPVDLISAGIFRRDGAVFAYRIDASFPALDHSGEYYAMNILNADGRRLMVQSSFEAPDDPDS